MSIKEAAKMALECGPVNISNNVKSTNQENTENNAKVILVKTGQIVTKNDSEHSLENINIETTGDSAKDTYISEVNESSDKVVAKNVDDSKEVLS